MLNWPHLGGDGGIGDGGCVGHGGVRGGDRGGDGLGDGHEGGGADGCGGMQFCTTKPSMRYLAPPR